MLQRRDHAAGTGARGPCLTEGSQRAHALAARQSTARRPRDRCAARLHRRAPRRATCLQRGQTLPPQGRTSTRAQQVWGRNRGSRKMGRKESWRKRHEERERERERERTCVCVCVCVKHADRQNSDTGFSGSKREDCTCVSNETKGALAKPINRHPFANIALGQNGCNCMQHSVGNGSQSPKSDVRWVQDEQNTMGHTPPLLPLLPTWSSHRQKTCDSGPAEAATRANATETPTKHVLCVFA